MCGSVIEAVQEMANDVLGTSASSSMGAADAVEDLFPIADDEFGSELGLEMPPLQDMVGDLFGDLSAPEVSVELSGELPSDFDSLSGLTDAGQIVIPEGYSPPAFVFEVPDPADENVPAELDASVLIGDRDYDIATALDAAVDPSFDNQSFDNGWNGASDIGNPPAFEIVSTGPDRY